MQRIPFNSYPLLLRISILFAICGGFVVIMLETMRRWHQMTDLHYFAAWFDDYLAGGFLIYAGFRTIQSLSNGIIFLNTAWGFATGMMYASFFIQLQNLQVPDPSSLPSVTVVMIKGVFFFGCIINLILTLWVTLQMKKFNNK